MEIILNAMCRVHLIKAPLPALLRNRPFLLILGEDIFLQAPVFCVVAVHKELGGVVVVTDTCPYCATAEALTQANNDRAKLEGLVEGLRRQSEATELFVLSTHPAPVALCRVGNSSQLA